MVQSVFATVSQRNRNALAWAKVIYVATVRKDGNQSRAAPVWFTVAPEDALLIQSARTGWIARRIRRGSPVIVWIGARRGPAFIGRAEITADVEVMDRIIAEYPRRYLLAQLGFHRPSRAMFEQGQIVAIRIAVVCDLPAGFVSRHGMPAPSADPSPARAVSPPRVKARREFFWRATANLLSASRFLLAALWLVTYASGERSPALMGPIAIAAAASDFADGRLARQAGSLDQFGRWLDAVADITFILAAVSCETRAGSIPVYIPLLISLSFTQYALDSTLLLGFAVPVASRLGHWAGVFNYILVITLALAPPPRLLGRLVRRAAPLIAIFYFAAILERAFNYLRARSIPRSI